MSHIENSLSVIQEQVHEWSIQNFGKQPTWKPLLGIQEEVGELAHAFLKRSQGIRTNEDHNENIKDAVADIMIYLMDFCSRENIELQDELIKTWNKVKKRDWKNDQEKGGSSQVDSKVADVLCCHVKATESEVSDE